MEVFEDPGFDLGAVVQVRPVRAQFEESMLSEIYIHYLDMNLAAQELGFVDLPAKFDDPEDMIKAYWAERLG